MQPIKILPLFLIGMLASAGIGFELAEIGYKQEIKALREHKQTLTRELADTVKKLEVSEAKNRLSVIIDDMDAKAAKLHNEANQE